MSDRYFSNSSRDITTVKRLSLGWKLNAGCCSRVSSRNRCTWFAVSLMSPKGDTEPGHSPSHLSIRSGEANDSLPWCRMCSRSCIAIDCSESNTTR